jgi:hypothetical protein
LGQGIRQLQQQGRSNAIQIPERLNNIMSAAPVMHWLHACPTLPGPEWAQRCVHTSKLLQHGFCKLLLLVLFNPLHVHMLVSVQARHTAGFQTFATHLRTARGRLAPLSSASWKGEAPYIMWNLQRGG